MNTTRRDTIKLLLGTAALAVVPSTVKAIDISPKLSKDDKIAKDIDYLLFRLEEAWCCPFHPEKDHLTIGLPHGSSNRAISRFYERRPSMHGQARIFRKTEDNELAIFFEQESDPHLPRIFWAEADYTAEDDTKYTLMGETISGEMS